MGAHTRPATGEEMGTGAKTGFHPAAQAHVSLMEPRPFLFSSLDVRTLLLADQNPNPTPLPVAAQGLQCDDPNTAAGGPAAGARGHGGLLLVVAASHESTTRKKNIPAAGGERAQTLQRARQTDGGLFPASWRPSRSSLHKHGRPSRTQARPLPRGKPLRQCASPRQGLHPRPS